MNQASGQSGDGGWGGGRAAEELRYALDLTGLDPASLGTALAAAGAELVRQPGTAGRALGELALEQGTVGVRALRRMLGDGAGAEEPASPDPRFADRAWGENPLLRGVLESYLVSSSWAQSLVEGLDLPDQTSRKARFALGILLDAMAPTNVLWLNPTVAKEAIDTGGLSLARGFRTFAEDVLHNGGLPHQVDRSSLVVGKDLAATPGRVVFRNDLVELLAYEPRTERVHAVPLVISPSWINKYYMLDLAPGRSFVEFAVQRGHSVFAMSYRNPDASMAELTLDDYLRDGLLASAARASELTGSEQVSVVAVCVGGTLTMLGLAALAARKEASRIASVTLLNSLVDYGEPGEIGVFIDEETLQRIEQRTTRRGYLEPGELAGPFTWMKASDLVWRYVVSNWFLGKGPPSFDILAWNDDATRLPARMHAQFLRTCYLENRLPRPRAFAIDGVEVDLRRVKRPLYVLGCEKDHITPWRSAYRTTQLVGGNATFTLASSGHIAGIVRPPGSSRASFSTGDDCPAEPDEWLRGSTRVEGSWWEHWADWIELHAGQLVAPPELPDGDPAPGSYVFG